jgi:hypothetical protein
VSGGIGCRDRHASGSTEGELTRSAKSLIEENIEDCL